MAIFAFFAFVLIASCSADEVVEPTGKIVQGLSLPQNRSVLPELTSNNVTGRSLLNGLVREAVLPFVVRELGLIECAGLDHTFGGNFFEGIMGKGADFGGDYLCQPTCGGDCIPTQGLGEAPISIYYPFGCRCAPTRCGPNGPVPTALIRPIFKVVCRPDPRCTCASMGPPGALTGYLCNWINLNTELPIGFRVGPYDPSLSPIRWCSCCPARA